MRRVIYVNLVVLLVAAAGADCATITVKADGTGDYPTIQAAIAAAVGGDEIVCADGVYTGDGNRDIDFLGKAITVRSENGPEGCIIDCNGTETDPHRGFLFRNSEGGNSILEGLTITNGYGKDEIIEEYQWPLGSAVFCYEASPTIGNCIMSNNTRGSVLFFYCGMPTVSNCTLSGNSGWYGNTAFFWKSTDPMIINCDISGNTGGSIIFWDTNNSTITDSTISNNTGEYEGAVYCFDTNLAIANSSIISNSGDYGGGGIYKGGNGNLTISNSTISSNLVTDYRSRGGGIYSTGDGDMIFTNCTIAGNSAGYYGGGICLKGNGKLTFTNCEITGNSADGGGGIYHLGDGELIFTDCAITGNSGDGGRGGGICKMGNGNLTMTNSTISGNEAVTGGGIYLEGNGKLTFTNCEVTGNSAADGGGIYHNGDGELTFTDCATTNNYAGLGGGIYSRYSSGLSLTNCTFTTNESGLAGGGAILARDVASVRMHGSTLSHNSTGYLDEAAIVISGFEIIEITGNTFIDDGISIGGYLNPTPTNAIISENIFKDFTFGGDERKSAISIHTATEPNSIIMVRGNIFSNFAVSKYDYLYAVGVTSGLVDIMDNTFEDLEGTGIHIRPSRNQTARANILNNEFINCASGGNLLSSAILLRGRFNGIVNADITNNTFRECGWNEDYPSAAIEIWGTSDVGICSSAVGNLILNCPYGIRIDGKEDCSLSGVFKNNTIANNLVGIEKGSRVDSLEVVNCILWDNTDDLVNVSVSEVTYSDISDGDFCGTNGNINTDPCFVKVGYWDANGTPDDFDDDFWVEGDYHLLEESVCINAGDPDYVAEPNETDLDGVPRVLFGRIDMGAYEYNFIEAEMDFVPEMLNCESKGDWVEAHIVLPEGYLPEDVDVNSPAVAEPIGAESEYIEVLDEGDGNYGIVAVFDREVFCEALGGDEEKELEVTVIGSFTDGVRFYGTDTIKLISDHWQHREIKN